MAPGTRPRTHAPRAARSPRRPVAEGSVSVALAAVLVLQPLAVAGQQATDAAETQARDWVGSVAAAVYAAAWPTATYEGFRLRRVNRLADGLSVLVRLSGESGFGGNLWLDLAFTFRQGQLFDMDVRAHNAILVPPFETTKTLAAATMEFAREFAQQQAAREAGSAATASGSASAAPGFYLRTGEDGSHRLLLRREGEPDRILAQRFAADTRLGDARLRTVDGMEVVAFVGTDDEWQVQYWWHLGTDGLYYAARDGSGRLVTSENFDAGPGTVGERMRRLVLEPWLGRSG